MHFIALFFASTLSLAATQEELDQHTEKSATKQCKRLLEKFTEKYPEKTVEDADKKATLEGCEKMLLRDKKECSKTFLADAETASGGKPLTPETREKIAKEVRPVHKACLSKSLKKAAYEVISALTLFAGKKTDQAKAKIAAW